MRYLYWIILRLRWRYFRLAANIIAAKILAGKVVPIKIEPPSEDEFSTNLLDGNAILDGPRVFFANSRLFSCKLGTLKPNIFHFIGNSFFHPELNFFRTNGYDKIRFLATLLCGYDLLNLPVILKRKKYLESGIIAFSEYNFNYYHFLIETVPAIMRAEKVLTSAAYSSQSIARAIFLEDNLHENFYELTSLNSSLPVIKCPANKLAISSGSVIMANATDRFFCRDLHSPIEQLPKHAEIANADIEILKEIRYNLRRIFLSKGELEQPPSRRAIYIPRRKGQVRAILNERQLLDLLPNHRLAPFDRLSIREQVREFALNKYIIAGSGAYLANLIFASSSSTIIILHSDNPNVIRSMDIWRCLQAVSDCKLVFVSGSTIPLPSLTYASKVHADFTINSQDLFKVISSEIGSQAANESI